MNPNVPLNQWLYKALIEKGMDGFSIVEVRDCLLPEIGEEINKRELRLKIYRQVYKLVDRGYLIKGGDKASPEARYFKTDAFRAHEYTSANRTKLPKETALVVSTEPSASVSTNDELFLGQLSRDKAQSEAELRITLGEVEEYKRVLDLYPEQAALIEPLYSKTKDQSAELLGRINALSKLVTSKC
ncbi:hypothetical protein [Enterovibrio sp. 27052020O]|uniref:hypothetical protein n=1 Tax=Enterovibrio sp. 27052020O TaxID=3241166 RepID=UPI00388D144E